MTTHSLKNMHTARVYEIEPGETGEFGDTEYLALCQGPLVLGGLLVDPNSFTEAEDDVSTVTITEEYTNTGAADNIDAFLVTGGFVEIYDLCAQVTTALSADVSTGKFQIVADEGPTTTDLCTTTSVASAAVGKSLTRPAAVGSALIVSAVGEGLIAGIPTIKVGPGKLRLVLSGNTTGAMVFKCRWRKLDPDAVVSGNVSA